MYKTICILLLFADWMQAAAQSEQRQFWALNGVYSGYTWDNTTGNNRVDNGGGSWDNIGQKWTVNNGVSDFPWKTGTTAIFGGSPGTGAAGTVTISGTQTVQSLQFNPAASGSFILAGGTLLNSSGLITVNAAATISSTLGGSAGLTLNGPGILTLATTPSFTGAVMLVSGTLLLTNGIANVYTSSLTNAVDIAAGATLAGDITGNINLAGNISGAGTLAVSGAGGQTLRLYGNNSGFTGNFSEPAGTRGMMWSDNAGAGNTSNTGSASAAWDLSGSFAFIETSSATTATVQLGSLSGSTSSTSIGGFGGSGVKTIQIGALNTNTSFAGSIQDNPQTTGTPVIALVKLGSGTQTLSGTNTYSGATTVNAGTLAFTTAFTSSPTWNISVNAATVPASSNSGLMTLAASPSLNGITVNILLTGSATGFTWNAASWSGSATGIPTLKINGTTVTSGAASGGTTVTFTAGSGIKVVR